MHHEAWLKDLLVFLVAAGLIVPLFHRARIGAVLGFLLVGVAVGPYGFGQLAGDYPWVRYLTIEDRARAEPFAELGVMFLLFLIGIEMSIERLWSLRHFVAGIGEPAVPALGRRHRPRTVASGRTRRRRYHSRARACDVVDRGGDAAPGGAGPHGNAARPGRDRGPAVPGSDGRAGPVRRGNPGARRQCRRRARQRTPAGGRGDRRDPGRGPLSVAPAVQRRGADRQPRADHGDDAPAGDRGGRSHRLCRAFDCARRISRRRAAVGDRIPPSGRGRHRAVQGIAARTVLHHRRDVARHPHGLERDRRSSCWRSPPFCLSRRSSFSS